MPIRTITTRAVVALVTALALSPVAAAAADREHQQIMADLRMLQEQTQQLQALMNDLGEALKAVNSRLDDQTSLERKAFADGKVQMDSMSGDIRIVREKVDETNVRLGSISQELESLRQAIPEPGATTPPAVNADAGTNPGTTTTPPAPGAPATSSRLSPQQLFQNSYGDYVTGNFTIAAQGFQTYVDTFPKSAQAHEAQLYIGEALLGAKNYADAVVAYDRVIANYPTSASVPQAYYKRGLAHENLKDLARARESFEAVIKQFPDSFAASLAKQSLERTNRPAR